MKKIISGLFFRLIRSFEIWALIALLIFAAGYIDYDLFNQAKYLSMVHSAESSFIDDETGLEYDLTDGGIKKYRFETQGISSFDAYRFKTEALDQETISKIEGESTYREVNMFCFMIGTSFSIPMILMMFFIPLFFGRLFGDGTVKNLISCGFSKWEIYLSSMVFTFLLDLFTVILNLLVLGFWCLYYEWKPPVYLPVVLTLFICSLLFIFTLTSLCLAILFASRKATVAIIAGFLIAVISLMSTSPVINPWSNISYSQETCEEGINEYREIFNAKMSEDYFDRRFDLSEFMVRLYYGGKEIRTNYDCSLSPAVKTIYLMTLYLNPQLVYVLTDINYSTYDSITFYMMYRDGLMAVNIASNIFWILIMNGAVILIDRKREIRG